VSCSSSPIATAYRTQWRNADSAAKTVLVRPRMDVVKIGPRKFRLRVFAAVFFAGKVAVVQRYARARGVWVRVRRVTLRTRGTGIAPTLISGATFRARVAARTKVRVVLRQAQVGPCYLASRSNVVTA
jgi:hypothetical protein